MARLRFDVRIERNLVPNVTRGIKSTVKQSVRTIAQDLARTSSESAPHKTGDLEDSYTVSYSMAGDKIVATVEFAVFKGGFNYAIAMHEWTYFLGPGSQAKAGGTGMSGTSYVVGRKFLTRVLEGESDTYVQYIAQQIRASLGG